MKSKVSTFVLSGTIFVGYLVGTAYANLGSAWCVVDNGTICQVCMDCTSGGSCGTVVAAANCTDPDEQPDCKFEVVDGVMSYSAECVAKSPTPIGGPGGIK